MPFEPINLPQTSTPSVATPQTGFQPINLPNTQSSLPVSPISNNSNIQPLAPGAAPGSNLPSPIPAITNWLSSQEPAMQTALNQQNAKISGPPATFGQNLIKGATQIGQDVYQLGKGFLGGLGGMAQAGLIGPAEQLWDLPGNLVGSVGNIIRGDNSFQPNTTGADTGRAGLQNIMNGLGEMVTSPMASEPVLQQGMKSIMDAATQLISSGVTKNLGVDPNSPQGQNLTQNILQAGMTLLLGGDGEPIEGTESATLGDKINNVYQAAKQSVSGIKDIPGALGLQVTSGGNPLAAIQNAWAEPAELPKFNKAADILKNASNNGHDITQTLVNNRISPQANIQDGNFATQGAADKLRSDNGQLSNDLLRPTLEMANPSVPRVPVSQIINDAQANINNDPTLLAEDKINLTKKIAAIQTPLEAQYPDGMQLTDLHDEKIVRANNGGYQPNGDIDSTAKAQTNRAVAGALRTTLENSAPPDMDVSEFNSELQKRYQAADYLDALDGKKAPVSAISKLANAAAKGAGATVAGWLGGGLFGGFAGYQLGGALESFLENLPGDAQIKYLNNLQTSNPEAFSQMTDAAAKGPRVAATPLLLPSPAEGAPMSSNNVPINLPNSIPDSTAQAAADAAYGRSLVPPQAPLLRLPSPAAGAPMEEAGPIYQQPPRANQEIMDTVQAKHIAAQKNIRNSYERAGNQLPSLKPGRIKTILPSR